MTPLADVPEERHLAAVAIISRHGATLAASRLTADDFHDPRCWAVIDVSCRLADTVDDEAPDPIEARALVVAKTTGMFLAELLAWVCAAPCMWDTGGHLADRVRAAGKRRRAARKHIDALEALGFVIRWERTG